MKKYLFILLLLLATVILKAQTPTVAELQPTGDHITWYDAATGGNILIKTALLVNGRHYYASQTVNGVESTARLDVTVTLVTVAAPTAGTHTPSQTQLVWNWNTVSGATGYKWSATNLYSSATDMGTAVTKTETGLTCNTAYSRYVWAYNGSGCVSAVTTLTKTTSSCVSAPTLTTDAVTTIGATTATFNGNITAINGANATTRGFKYSTTNGFDAANTGTNISESGTFGTGAFSLIPSSLTSTTTYYVVAYATNSAGTTYGSQVTFTTIVYMLWTFTNAAATDYTGPTQAQVNTAYASTSLAGGVTVSSGIQQWIVPTTGTYRIDALGAQGGSIGAYSGGLGARIRGDFSLTAGDVLQIIVGQTGIGAGAGSGGGGGSFVIQSPYNTNGSILVIGGGGGGALSYVPGAMNGYNGLSGNSGGTTSNPGGSGTGCAGPGTGGTSGYGGSEGCAAGGGGYLGNGVEGGHQAGGGTAFINGGAGGVSTNSPFPHGGFGAGGAGSPSNGYGGGGGGYSGGGGGGWTTLAGNGGGGGSYNTGTNPSNTAGSNGGNGQVIITKL